MSAQNAPHPIQPIALDEHGVARFKKNAIVEFLLEAGPYDLNKIARMPWAREDRVQLAQLIGYSLSGWGDLSYVTDEDRDRADAEDGLR